MMLLILGLLNAQMRFEVVPIPGENCSARAMNQLSEVIFECKLPLNSSQLWFWDGASKRPLTGAFGVVCASATSNGINNAQQRIQRETYLSHCGLGGSFSQWNLFLSGGQSSRFEYYYGLSSLNDSGYFLHGNRALWRSPDVIRYPEASTGGYSVTGLNNSMQSLIKDGGEWHRYEWTTGRRERIPVSMRSPLLNQRGWVAGVDTRDLVQIWNGSTISELGQPPGERHAITAFNDHGWILGTGSLGQWLWDGTSFALLADLIAEPVALEAVAGLNNDGRIAATIRTTDETLRAVLLSPMNPLEPLTEIFNPEAGPELEGRGEAVGCKAITGWVIDRKHPERNIPLEMYEGTRLIAGGIAEKPHEDGTWGFQVPIPPKLLDGKPHFVNVRFAGYATAVDQAWGTIECPPE